MLDYKKINAGGAALILIALALVIFGLTQLSDDSGEPVAAAGGTPKQVDEQAIELFQGNCGQCHTLAVASTAGAVGPNLDEQLYESDRVLQAIALGGRGSGAMPANLLEGEEAELVAELVAQR